jgi:hypothetical protein
MPSVLPFTSLDIDRQGSDMFRLAVEPLEMFGQRLTKVFPA